MRKLSHDNTNQKNAGVAILISDKADIRIQNHGQIGYYIILKASILQEDIPILNVYIPKNCWNIWQRMLELQGETDKFTLVVRDLIDVSNWQIK